MIWAFIIWLAVLIPFATNTHLAYNTTTKMLVYMPFIISTIVLVNDVERLRKIVTLYIILMIYISLYSITHGGIGSGNYFMDENDVSLFINMWVPFCYFLFVYETRWIRKAFYLIGLMIGLVAVIATFSRGGFVGLLCVGFVIWLFSPRKMLSVIAICCIAAVLYFTSSEEYKREMSTVTDTQDDTASSRLKSWATGWDMFVDNPLGVGGGNFAINFNKYQEDRFKRGMWGRVAHSLWFTLIPELGLIGIFVYLRLLYLNIRNIFYIKQIKWGSDEDHQYMYALSLAFIASLAGFFSSATFISVLYYPHYWYMTALIVVATIIARELQASTVNQSNDVRAA